MTKHRKHKPSKYPRHQEDPEPLERSPASVDLAEEVRALENRFDHLKEEPAPDSSSVSMTFKWTHQSAPPPPAVEMEVQKCNLKCTIL